MRYNSKGMTCGEFVHLMRDRGIQYDSESGRFVKKDGSIKGKTNHNGYRTIALNKDHVGYTFCEHRCVWVWFNGDIPDGMEINHIDADRGNNRIENLELVNHSQNMRHAINIGNFNAAKAEESGKAIYSNYEVLAMRSLHKHGWNYNEIAEAFKAKYPNSIARLIKGERYGNVDREISFDDAMNVVIWNIQGVGA